MMLSHRIVLVRWCKCTAHLSKELIIQDYFKNIIVRSQFKIELNNESEIVL